MVNKLALLRLDYLAFAGCQAGKRDFDLQSSLTVGEVDSVVSIEFNGFRVEFDRLLIIASLELLVSAVLQ